MNHIRSFFRPAPTLSARQAAGHESGSRSRAQQQQHRLERDANPLWRPVHASHGGRGGAVTSSSHSVASGSALDHLYESYRDNVAAADLKSSAGRRKPCMVVREYNEGYYASTGASSSIFLPEEYRIVSEASDEATTTAASVTDCLLGRHTLAGAPATTGSENTATSASASTTQRTLSSAGHPIPKASVSTTHTTGTRPGETDSGADRRESSASHFTVSEVMALRSSGEDLDGVGVTEAPRRGCRRAAQERRRSTIDKAAPAAPAAGEASSLHVGAPASISSRTCHDELLDSADVRRRVRYVVPPPPPQKQQQQQQQQQLPGAGAPADRGGSGGAGPAEVEVVRLNAEFYTQSELARWHQYQMVRMESFIAAGSQQRTPSQSTQSRDPPSSNSASGVEFMPVLRNTISRSTDTDERERVEDDYGVGVGGGASVRTAPCHLVRVLHPVEATVANRDGRAGVADGSDDASSDHSGSIVEMISAGGSDPVATESSRSGSSSSSSSDGGHGSSSSGNSVAIRSERRLWPQLRRRSDTRDAAAGAPPAPSSGEPSSRARR
ncbi:hypothetical protein NESM_000309600 [Novymonas esmeraldas]|uniref:Uncharacterized protein n=1 Tax=Novymonas esmeraldas TaxID=1808958 RepID=A0AAW0EKZ6_9TRYP